MAGGKYEFSQLRCFVAVAEELNFRRAAERLHMTQPPLSRQIRLLEHGLGLQLLERTNRRVSLTPAGESFYDSATDMLQRSEHAILKARQAQRGQSGSIALGFVPSAALEFVPRIVTMAAERFPGVTLDPTEMMSYEIVEAQRSGRLDLGLTRMEQTRPEIARERVVSEPFILAIPRSHPLADKANPMLEDLNGAPFVGYSTERGGFVRETHQTLLSSRGVTPRIVQEVSQTHTVLAMVNSGIGAALVPASSRVLGMKNVRFVDLDLPRQFRSDLYLIYRAGERTVLQERMRQLIVEALAPYND
ncbi:LysR family transcriptional regulator [Psychromarinibacter halotolerans]|uniref:LysR family transcriptional regulator n=1 Tax=Psychromarinibacter halotolerans TaxID=1775175 RepID=A0ABV7GU47_9RHOB|nr:LysR family transcriptional regulator [Psychromarinibacter halotolerans]MDF0598351.1 LysR family transcriptional regulator [Psychromarinibacter halotolerans]